jgi:hypothetical protein
MVNIIRNQRKVVGQGACCEDQIEVIEGSAPFFETGFEFPECLDRCQADRNYLESGFNGPYPCEVYRDPA